MRIFALLLVFVLGSCAGSSGPPSNQTDACSVLSQKRGWLRDLRQSEATWGVPIHVQMATIWKESNYSRRAKTSKNTSFGLSLMDGFRPHMDTVRFWMELGTGTAMKPVTAGLTAMISAT